MLNLLDVHHYYQNVMDAITFNILNTNDTLLFEVIANWYLREWNIPKEKTVQNLENITKDSSQFQALMSLNGIPISTGGIYNHVGLLDKEPRFNIYKNWLALVYTIPKQRQMGYGALICKFIQNQSMKLGLEHLYLYTDTAEKLYAKLGWKVVERLRVGKRNLVVMDIHI